jgi:uncharacterized protein (TIGR02996 family)
MLVGTRAFMRVEQALMAAIHDSPGDETSWLVLADWLEEQGEADRAELLRLHRRLRDLDEGRERERLEGRVQEMLRAGVRPCVPTLVNSVGMELALIPEGWFRFGSPPQEEGRYYDEGPRRRTAMTRPFYLGVYPVTQAEYERVTGDNPSAFRRGGEREREVRGASTRRHPVEQVSWHDAAAFCQRLSSSLPAERDAGRVYRLPTEAEWEYACRGGAALCTPFPLGKTISEEVANFRGEPRRRDESRHTTPVGSYPPNGFGLYDMVGNVWEWCADWYHSSTYAHNPRRDPPGPREGERRIARGGMFNLDERRVRCADRSSFDPEHRDNDLGFRVLCEWRPPIVTT